MTICLGAKCSLRIPCSSSTLNDDGFLGAVNDTSKLCLFPDNCDENCCSCFVILNSSSFPMRLIFKILRKSNYPRCHVFFSLRVFFPGKVMNYKIGGGVVLIKYKPHPPHFPRNYNVYITKIKIFKTRHTNKK